MRHDGFEGFVATRGGALMRTASLLTSNEVEAEGALQEALTRAAMRWRKVARDESPELLVRQLLYTVVVDQVRRQRQLDAVPDGVAPDASSSVSSMMLSDALRQLTTRQRVILVLRFYEDLSQEQVAEAVGWSQSLVNDQTVMALARLRELSPDLVEAFDSAELPPQHIDETEGGSSTSEVLS